MLSSYDCDVVVEACALVTDAETEKLDVLFINELSLTTTMAARGRVEEIFY